MMLPLEQVAEAYRAMDERCATYVRFGQRVSQEGGADIPTSWAVPR